VYEKTLYHTKNATTNQKSTFKKKGEMEGVQKFKQTSTSQVLLNRLQIPAIALLILGITFFSNLSTDVDLKTFL